MSNRQNTFLSGPNAPFIEELYARYVENPAAIDPSWRRFFDELDDDAALALKDIAGASWAPRNREAEISNGYHAPTISGDVTDHSATMPFAGPDVRKATRGFPESRYAYSGLSRKGAFGSSIGPASAKADSETSGIGSTPLMDLPRRIMTARFSWMECSVSTWRIYARSFMR